MTENIVKDGSPFDFSQDAAMFRQRLWLRLKAQMEVATAQLLDDDDLSLIHAAGMANVPLDQDDLMRR